jgi:hypothetical protein
MCYQMGNFVPWHDAAWVPLSERAVAPSRQCAHTGTYDRVSRSGQVRSHGGHRDRGTAVRC